MRLSIVFVDVQEQIAVSRAICKGLSVLVQSGKLDHADIPIRLIATWNSEKRIAFQFDFSRVSPSSIRPLVTEGATEFFYVKTVEGVSPKDLAELVAIEIGCHLASVYKIPSDWGCWYSEWVGGEKYFVFPYRVIWPNQASA